MTMIRLMKTVDLRPLLFASVLMPVALQGQNPWAAVADDARLLLDLRSRYETAEMDGLADSKALTLRTRFGVQTGEVYGFSALIEGEDIRLLSDSEQANLAGQTTTDVPRTPIADPEETELNRLWLNWRNESAGLKVGRQRVIHDNSRFIGNVGWRQNEQTFDAIRVDWAGSDRTWEAEYAYVDRVQRIFGDDAPGGADFDAEAHFARVGYTLNDRLKVAGFAYLQRLYTASGAPFGGSNDTFGFRVTGSQPVGDAWKFSYAGSVARQVDNGANPEGSSFDLGYYALSGDLVHEQGSIGLGWERLEGNGSRMFTTPLATVHAFNGWADVFLGPSIGGAMGSGLDDLYVDARYKLPVGKGLALRGVFHWFSAEGAGGNLGTELDLLAVYPLTKQLKATAKYARFESDTAALGDKSVFWLQLDFAY